jgi:hypothetical protein
LHLGAIAVELKEAITVAVRPLVVVTWGVASSSGCTAVVAWRSRPKRRTEGGVLWQRMAGPALGGGCEAPGFGFGWSPTKRWEVKEWGAAMEEEGCDGELTDGAWGEAGSFGQQPVRVVSRHRQLCSVMGNKATGDVLHGMAA